MFGLGKNKNQAPPPPRKLSRQQVEKILEDSGSLAGCDLSGLDLTGLEFSQIDMQGARLAGVRAQRVEFSQCNMRGSSWEGAALQGCEFSQCEVQASNFYGAQLVEVEFSQCEMQGVNLSGAVKLERCRFVQCDGLSGLRPEQQYEDFSDIADEPRLALARERLRALAAAVQGRYKEHLDDDELEVVGHFQGRPYRAGLDLDFGTVEVELRCDNSVVALDICHDPSATATPGDADDWDRARGRSQRVFLAHGTFIDTSAAEAPRLQHALQSLPGLGPHVGAWMPALGLSELTLDSGLLSCKFRQDLLRLDLGKLVPQALGFLASFLPQLERGGPRVAPIPRVFFGGQPAASAPRVLCRYCGSSVELDARGACPACGAPGALSARRRRAPVCRAAPAPGSTPWLRLAMLPSGSGGALSSGVVMLRPSSALLVLSSLVFLACSGGDDASELSSSGGQGGSAGKGGVAGAGNAAGSSSGSGGSSAGKGGSAGQGGAAAGGAGGSAGAGKGGVGGGVSGSSGQSGASGAPGGAAGKSGAAGQAGKAGAAGGPAGASGAGGSGQAGDAGSGQGGAGQAGAGQSGAGQAGAEQGGAGQAGSGQAGAGEGGAGQGGGCAGPEVCNGLDDDCDGQIDNNPTDVGKACPASGVEGACQSGTLDCQGGALTCVAAAPSAEICDGVDNDCDGTADNNLTDTGADCFTDQKGVCAPGKSACNGGVLTCVALLTPTDEVCDGKDNNCDGNVDEGFAGAGQPCQVAGQQGLCQTGQTSCLNGGNSCTQTVFPGAEVCDGLDNDCDGVADNNLTDTNTPCDTGKQGVCAAGVTSCSGGALVCAAVNLPTSEECNGLDDDCNGSVDDGLPDLKCGVGECAVTTPACVDGVTQSCFPKDPVAEVCDQKDNNCDGVVDDGNVCCPVAQRCGALCCVGGDVCSFQQCVTPGKVCTASEDCAGGEFCDYSLGGETNPPPGCQGSKQKTGKCMPKPPSCGVGQDPGDPPVCVQKCEYKPPVSSFDPVLKYSWGGQTTSPFNSDVMMTPVVAQLDDDDCDGKITERDIPEILFTTFSGGKYYGQGTLHAISIVNGQIVNKLNLPNVVQGSSGLSVADLDGDGKPEIVACMAPAPGGVSCCDAQAQNTGVVAFRADGTVLWQQTDTTKVHCGYDQPAVADPNKNGKPLVLVGYTLLDGKTGAVVRELDPATSYGSKINSFADVDGDGTLDVVNGQRAYRIDGSVIWDLRSGANAIPLGYHAIGDLDKDGIPEVIVTGGNHQAHVIRYDASNPQKTKVIRKGIDINNGISTAQFCNAGSEYGGGAPTVADFDGDGFPDVGVAGAVGYMVLNGKKLMDGAVPNNQTTLWFKQTHDCSSAVTGSSVFDFNGDGKAEVLYSDEYHLWMYDGVTGSNLIPSTCNTTGTLWEYPVVADVDNDGQADIVVASNAYGITCPDNNSKQSGIRIFGSKNNSWVRTRRVWNQHTYHVTNINEDGSVPQVEAINWKQPGLNNFRQNKQPGGEFSAPDLVVSLAPTCQGPYALVATVRNLGEAPVGPGVKVGFYTASGQKLGEASTTVALYPAGAETLSLPLGQAPAEDVYVLADDNSPAHPWVECRVNNNKSASVKPTCAQ